MYWIRWWGKSKKKKVLCLKPEEKWNESNKSNIAIWKGKNEKQYIHGLFTFDTKKN